MGSVKSFAPNEGLIHVSSMLYDGRIDLPPFQYPTANKEYPIPKERERGAATGRPAGKPFSLPRALGYWEFLVGCWIFKISRSHYFL
jgi:hypothetical protein